jgi:hypothetical protein
MLCVWWARSGNTQHKIGQITIQATIMTSEIEKPCIISGVNIALNSNSKCLLDGYGLQAERKPIESMGT